MAQEDKNSKLGSYMPEDKIVGTPTYDNDIYFMTYRCGQSMFNIKGFKHKGGLQAARNRAFEHGNKMNYKNIFVFPLISDLDEIEKKQAYSGESFLGSHPEFENKALPVEKV